MVTTADSSGTGFPNDNLEFRRSVFLSPWEKIVRGKEEPISAAVQLGSSVVDCPEETAVSKVSRSLPPPDYIMPNESSNSNNSNAATRTKKAAWKTPSNGTAEVGPLIGAISWPPLSESARASSKLPADSPSNAVSAADGSVPTPPEPLNAPHKQATSSEKPISTANHTVPTRPRYTKRGGGGGSMGGPRRGGFTHPTPPPPPPPPPPFPLFNMPQNSYGGMIPPMLDPSQIDPSIRGHNWDMRPVGGFVHQPRGINDRRNSSRRGNFSHHPRGDGSHPNNNNYYYNNSNHGVRRDQDRRNYHNGHLQQQRPSSRGSVRPPPPPYSAPYLSPQLPIRNNLPFPEHVYFPTLPFDPYRSMPYMPPPAVYVPVQENPLSTMLVNQIDYYFSDDNLVKDIYLRSHMDEHGWVPISLIAGFRRVQTLTNDIQFIIESLRSSTGVEVQHDKVRRRNEWMKWTPTLNQPGMNSGSSSRHGSTDNVLATYFSRITVGEAVNNQDMSTDREDRDSNATTNNCSIESADHSQVPSSEVNQNVNSLN